MQLGALGPPPPHMDPNLVSPPHSHLSPEPTPLPPSALTPQSCASPPIIPSSSSMSPSISAGHPHHFHRTTSPNESMLSGAESVERALISTNRDNKSSINALECLRPWTSPHSPHFSSISAKSSPALTLTASIDSITDTAIENKG